MIAYRQPKPESDWDVALMVFAGPQPAVDGGVKRNAAPEAAE